MSDVDFGIDPWAGAATIAARVRAGQWRAQDVIEAALHSVALRDPVLNAFTDITCEHARRQAQAIDAGNGAGLSGADLPLAGVPFAVKNLFDVAGLPTRAGSQINRDRAPATRDAALVGRLEAAGAVLLGTCNMGEYAYDFTGENSHDGPSRNPHDPARMSGGSSGGSASAVAGGIVPFALGSDTNGSIRVPSSFCGLFGLKPTYGRLARAGSFPFVSSFDHLGPLARSVLDLALCYDAMQGPDPDDPACAARPADPVTPSLDAGAAGLRIAVATGYFRQGASSQALAAVERVAQALGATAEIDLPDTTLARSAAYIISTTEGAALHLRRLRTRPDEFDPDVRDRLLAGAMVPAALVTQAQKFRRWYRDQVAALFETVDAIIAPATPTSAPLIGQKTFVLDGEEMLVRPNIGLFTQPFSFIGLPVVAVPVFTDTLPIGVQIVAAPWREDVALRIAAQLERDGVAAARRPQTWS